jgi:Kef-type K+ transport system membrane component KefB
MALGLLAGLYASGLAKKLHMPQVLGYVIAGALLGPSGLGVLAGEKVEALGLLSKIALAMIGFVIGSELALPKMARLGKAIGLILLFECTGALVLVGAATYLLTRSLPLALLLGSIATATAPAGTVDVLQELKARGPLTTALYAVVALDDAVSLAAYGICLPLALHVLGAGGGSLGAVVLAPVREIGLSALVGLTVGLVLMVMASRMKRQAETLVLVLASTLFICGVSRHWEFSLILASMFSSFIAATLKEQVAHRMRMALQGFSEPIYLLFFVLVGARLDVRVAAHIGLLGVLYVAFLALGKGFGAYFGARLGRAPGAVSRYLGFGLLSQAGVAVGLSLATWERLADLAVPGARELGTQVVTLIAATTFVLQLVGPPLLRFAVLRAGEGQREE